MGSDSIDLPLINSDLEFIGSFAPIDPRRKTAPSGLSFKGKRGGVLNCEFSTSPSPCPRRYDAAGRVTATLDSSDTAISQYDYTLGLTGRRDQIIDMTGATTSYSYDDLYRLLREDITGHPALGTVANDYQYDPVGNRTYATEAGVSTAYTYDADDRLITAGGEMYTYDNNGNTLTKTIDATVVTNTYDDNNRLIRMIKTEAGTEVDNVSYQYDIDGLRTAKNDDGITTNYVVDKNRDYAQVLNELDSTSTPTVSYVYGDDLIKQTRAANDSYYLYDGLGSTRALTDATGSITDTYDYSAYGTEIDSTGTTENSYRYTGEQFDAHLNQIYLRARYYDPGTGRFTQQDAWMGVTSILKWSRKTGQVVKLWHSSKRTE